MKKDTMSIKKEFITKANRFMQDKFNQLIVNCIRVASGIPMDDFRGPFGGIVYVWPRHVLEIFDDCVEYIDSLTQRQEYILYAGDILRRELMDDRDLGESVFVGHLTDVSVSLLTMRFVNNFFEKKIFESTSLRMGNESFYNGNFRTATGLYFRYSDSFLGYKEAVEIMKGYILDEAGGADKPSEQFFFSTSSERVRVLSKYPTKGFNVKDCALTAAMELGYGIETNPNYLILTVVS